MRPGCGIFTAPFFYAYNQTLFLDKQGDKTKERRRKDRRDRQYINKTAFAFIIVYVYRRAGEMSVQIQNSRIPKFHTHTSL